MDSIGALAFQIVSGIALLLGFILLFKTVAHYLRKPQLCKSCGSIEKPEQIVPGSLILEIILWCFFFLPGLCYTAYRIAKKYWACPNCGSRELIPTDSPIASKFMKDNALNPIPPEKIGLSNWPPKATHEE